MFGDLIRDSQGRATFTVSGKKLRVTVQFAAKYQVAILFSPTPRVASAPPANAQQPPRPAEDTNSASSRWLQLPMR